MTDLYASFQPLLALSISDSPDADGLGLSAKHQSATVVDIVRLGLSMGIAFGYGGDLRRGGYTELLAETIRRYKRDTKAEPLVNFLPWYIHAAWTRDEVKEQLAALESAALVLFLDQDGTPRQDDYRLAAASVNTASFDAACKAQSLSGMRREMQRACRGRIAVGGKVNDYSGLMPGILEEVLVSLDQGQPVYLIGGYGGSVRDAGKAILGDSVWPERLDEEKGPGYDDIIGKLAAVGPDGLNNGLTEQENRELLGVWRGSEAAALILRGLQRSGLLVKS
jgi:hypothetical protein